MDASRVKTTSGCYWLAFLLSFTSLRSSAQMPDNWSTFHHDMSIGTDALGRVLVAVYSFRGDDVRLISARSATRNERSQYEEGV